VALFAALRALPDKQRQATVLFYVADLPITEIAEAMAASVGTVKSWLHRARTTLARELGVLPSTDTQQSGTHRIGKDKEARHG